MTTEAQRLEENTAHRIFWKKWGPCMSERQWGTVREDYSHNGDAWKYFPFDHARSRAYRWGKMVSPGYPIFSRISASALPSGTAGILYSWSWCS